MAHHARTHPTLNQRLFREGQSTSDKLFQWLSPCQEEGLPFWSAFVWPHSPPSALAIIHQSLQEAADQVWTEKAAAHQGTAHPQFTPRTAGIFEAQA